MKKTFVLFAVLQLISASCRKSSESTGLLTAVAAADSTTMLAAGTPELGRMIIAQQIAGDLHFRELRTAVFAYLDRWEKLVPFTGDTTAYLHEFRRLSLQAPLKAEIAALRASTISFYSSNASLPGYSREDQRYIIRESFRLLRPMRHASCKYGYDNDRDDCRIDAGTETIINLGGMTVFGGAGLLAGVWVQGGILVKRYQCMQRAARDYKTCIANEFREVTDLPVEGKDYKLINCRYPYSRRVCDTLWITRLNGPVKIPEKP